MILMLWSKFVELKRQMPCIRPLKIVLALWRLKKKREIGKDDKAAEEQHRPNLLVLKETIADNFQHIHHEDEWDDRQNHLRVTWKTRNKVKANLAAFQNI